LFSEFFSDIVSEFPCMIEPFPILQQCSKNRSWYTVQGNSHKKNAKNSEKNEFTFSANRLEAGRKERRWVRGGQGEH
jgi:hypothetical protein